ncbi:MAG: undecaprenyl-diphosphate phosphatase [Chloroflexi bacterium]|nr:undecaprenyl-diphosphate phosphatase [Chloroflexota bacterium]
MDLSLIFQALVLGILQGLTEFLPISSSAHLVLVPWLFGWNNTVISSLPFDVALHIGTLISVLAYFANDWLRLVRAGISSIVERKIGKDPDRRLAWLIVIGSIPGAVVGALAESQVEETFHAPNAPVAQWAIIAIAVILALLGLILFIAERAAKHIRSIAELKFTDALLIGVAQALAIFPGVSRSGATITAGLLLNLKRDDAARFSFLLSAPIIAGAGLKGMYDVSKEIAAGQLDSSGLLLYGIGFAAAAVTGFLAIRFLLRYLRRNSTDIFVYYRWTLAVIIIVVALLRG